MPFTPTGPGQWVTIRGHKIFVEEGQSPKDAFIAALSRIRNTNNDVPEYNRDRAENESEEAYQKRRKKERKNIRNYLKNAAGMEVTAETTTTDISPQGITPKMASDLQRIRDSIGNTPIVGSNTYSTTEIQAAKDIFKAYRVFDNEEIINVVIDNTLGPNQGSTQETKEAFRTVANQTLNADVPTREVCESNAISFFNFAKRFGLGTPGSRVAVNLGNMVDALLNPIPNENIDALTQNIKTYLSRIAYKRSGLLDVSFGMTSTAFGDALVLPDKFPKTRSSISRGPLMSLKSGYHSNFQEKEDIVTKMIREIEPDADGYVRSVGIEWEVNLGLGTEYLFDAGLLPIPFYGEKDSSIMGSNPIEMVSVPFPKKNLEQVFTTLQGYGDPGDKERRVMKALNPNMSGIDLKSGFDQTGSHVTFGCKAKLAGAVTTEKANNVANHFMSDGLTGMQSPGTQIANALFQGVGYLLYQEDKDRRASIAGIFGRTASACSRYAAFLSSTAAISGSAFSKYKWLKIRTGGVVEVRAINHKGDISKLNKLMTGLEDVTKLSNHDEVGIQTFLDTNMSIIDRSIQEYDASQQKPFKYSEQNTTQADIKTFLDSLEDTPVTSSPDEYKNRGEQMSNLVDAISKCILQQFTNGNRSLASLSTQPRANMYKDDMNASEYIAHEISKNYVKNMLKAIRNLG